MRDNRSLLLAAAALAGIFGFSSAKAAEVVPRLVREPGKPVTLEFSDGRRAALEFSEGPAFPVAVPMELTESTCPGPKPSVKCRLTSPLAYDGFRFVWTKNTDASKAGAVLETAGGAKLANEDLWNAAHAAFYPDLFPAMPGLSLDCDDFLWLPGGSADAPASYDVVSWSSELMHENSETKRTENMAVGGAYDVRLEKTGPRAMKLAAAGQWVGKDLATALKSFLVGDVVNLVVANPEGGYCQIAFKPGFYAGIAQAEALDAALDRRWVPVVEGGIAARRFDVSKTYGFFLYNVEHVAEGKFQ